MKVRFHRGLLADSMATQFEAKDWEDFCKHCEAENILTNEVKCEHYFGADDRIGWKDTWIISAMFFVDDGNGKRFSDGKFYPVAFSDENVLRLKRKSKIKKLTCNHCDYDGELVQCCTEISYAPYTYGVVCRTHILCCPVCNTLYADLGDDVRNYHKNKRDYKKANPPRNRAVPRSRHR